ncbi:MAG: hypothetical protein QG565_1521, partial [Campylobacterota bacterium]|nr:hypothetical protein [Campylobacterota bacterium]
MTRLLKKGIFLELTTEQLKEKINEYKKKLSV